MHKKRPSSAALREMLTEPHFGASRDLAPADPVMPTPMIVEIDRIDPYERNPRRERNAAYDDIRDSIRVRGMDHPLTITRRPDTPNYIVEAGGNTRLMILKELWQETGDAQFHRIHCLFRPWVSEINVLAAHLIENETRGDLVFIDKALGVRDLKRQIEQETGEELSLRRFSESLGALGYRASKSLLSMMDYAVDVLLPLIPQALRAGMGRPRIQGIRRIESACRGYWRDRNAVMAEFDTLFADALSCLDGEGIDIETFQEMIESRIANLLDIPINHVRLDLDARLFQPGTSIEDRDHDSVSTQAPPSVSLADVELAGNPSADEVKAARATREAHLTSESALAHPPSVPPLKTPAHATVTPTDDPQDASTPQRKLPSDLKSLRSRAYVLALKLAKRHELESLVTPTSSLGLGFWVEVPETPLLSSKSTTSAELFRCWVWWWLLALSEEFAAEHVAYLPETSLVRHMLLTDNHDLVFKMAGTPLLPFPVAEFITHPEADERDIDELWQLIQTCRHIRRTVNEDTLWNAS
jgi:ParB family protein of integrating conjugative element (PFGI_1 class)